VFHGRRHPDQHKIRDRRRCCFCTSEVLGGPIEEVEVGVRARRPERLPVVLTWDEVRRLLNSMSGVSSLVAGLLYGSGLRLTEALELRIKDIDFERCEIRLRDGKGRKDRVTMLSMVVKSPLREHLQFVRRLHE
jgi:integrase